MALVSGAEVGGRSPPGARTGTHITAVATANTTAVRSAAAPPRLRTAASAAAPRITASQIAAPPLRTPSSAAAVTDSGINARGAKRSRIATTASPAAVATRTAPATSLTPPHR